MGERYFVLDKFNTWYDWNLILTGKDVPPPEPKTSQVDIDGIHGVIDLSEALTGEVMYKNRTIAATFWTNEGKRQEREVLRRNILTAVHGKKIRVVEPDDPDHYFMGRVKIKAFANTIAYATIELEIDCEPWRYDMNESTRRATVNHSTVDLVIRNEGVKTLCPELAVSGSVKVTFDGVETALTTGNYKLTGLRLRHGANVVRVSGNGTIILTYREADL